MITPTKSVTTKWVDMPQAVACYAPAYIYALEKQWFKHSQSFGLMQQAAWQITHWLLNQGETPISTVLVVVGAGNNGGDGWLVAHYLAQHRPTWHITVVEMAAPTTADSQQAKAIATILPQKIHCIDYHTFQAVNQQGLAVRYEVIIDAMFGIGLSRGMPADYTAISRWINQQKNSYASTQVISIDVPSGVNAATGEVYEDIAIHADITLCLGARKIGLHLGDAKAYVGRIIDIPLMPLTLPDNPIFYLNRPQRLSKRAQISHKGSYGHVLIIGGNRLETGQGMAGAALLSASSAFAAGTGKVTVACHRDFHGAIIANLPNAMTADLHDALALSTLIAQVDVVAIGMGMGRDAASYQLFEQTLKISLAHQKSCVIDADGLFHLSQYLSKNCPTPPTAPSLNPIAPPQAIDLQTNNVQTSNPQKLAAHCYCTPHAGEAARLLGIDYQQVDRDKLSALTQLSQQYGGQWLIKGAETLVSENGDTFICGLGNAGMATAGMGDCLAGVVASFVAQHIHYPLISATLIHAKAGDCLAASMGEYGLQAKHMAAAIADTIHSEQLS